MPFSDPGAIADVASGGALDPDWGNALRDRLVHHFASATARDAAITAPTEGMACWLADVDQYLVYNGVAWRQPWNMPWGQVAAANASTTSQTGITTSTVDVTGVTVTFTAVANRLLVIQGWALLTKHTAGDFLVTAQDGSNTLLGYIGRNTLIDGGNAWVSGQTPAQTPAAGSITYKLRIAAISGTVDVGNAAGRTAGIRVLDVGPNGSPA